MIRTVSFVIRCTTSTFSVQVSLVFTRYGVEEHEVLKVGDLSSLPALGHVGGLVELFRTGQRNPSVGKTQITFRIQRVT